MSDLSHPERQSSTTALLPKQAIPFLLALWLHAVFVRPGSAAQLGWVWLLSRVLYPFVFGLGIPFLFLSTILGYLCITGLMAPLVKLALL